MNSNYSMWNCPSCTLLNDYTLLHCTLCSTPRQQPQFQDSLSMTNSNVTTHHQQNEYLQQEQYQSDPSLNARQNNRKQKGWKTVSSASSLLSFEYGDDSHRKRNGNYNNNKTSSIDDLANYGFGFEDYTFNDIEAITHSNISHSSIKNVKQLTRNSKYRNSADGAAESRFKSKSSANNGHSHGNAIAASYNDKYLQNQQRLRKQRSKYSITDIFASNSSFILDHQYNEDDICNLILNNSTQTQTKIKFLKSIWPHILRVSTRVLDASKFRCPICLDEHILIGRITECGHCFCGTCLLHHLFSYQNSTKTEKDQRIIPEIKDENNYNFTDLFGHCPLCHEYVAFEQCRPLTVIRCHEYKVGDNISMALIERRKGEQPQFTPNYNHNLNISTFRKFETEKLEIQQCDKELLEIKIAIKSSDPIYEEPFLRLLSIHVQQYKQYIIQQRSDYNITSKPKPNPNLKQNQFQSRPQRTERKRDGDFEQKHQYQPFIAKPSNAFSNAMQQLQFEQNSMQQHRYRKKKYVYQSDDGQLFFLHPHNYNMLKHDINYDFDSFPSLITNCKILEIERYIQSYDLRRKYPFLAFIPVDVSFNFVEVDLSQVVNKSTLKYFEKTTMDRQQYRIEQAKIAEKEEKHQQIMEEQRIALQRQKYARPQIDINDHREFPSLAAATDESNSNSDNNSAENNNRSSTQITSPLLTSINRKSPLQRSWSQITLNKSDDKQKSQDSPSFKSIASTPKNGNKQTPKSGSINSSGSGSGSGHKKKRRRGRNKKKNKNKEKE